MLITVANIKADAETKPCLSEKAFSDRHGLWSGRLLMVKPLA
ncbi:hypothetical protein HMPREF9370_0516 [Neisseria wadsworthii 9715]|uniref:Uncharacterized protein n=1 Tax=Neisseria wadsworthii 9715 TaxID=1030841 RepID=G4CN57_9NEIS|nr:hypothetical protein HMPREF9370_0516 [Neisseria wadsworthii 9715]